MGGTFTSWGALKAAIQKEMYSATEETVDMSFQDLHTNVDSFYVNEGNYKRTGQLAESPQIDEFSCSGDSATAQLSLDTSYTYNPSGRDTDTIYNYAENNGLLGKGGFWEKTEEDIQHNLDESFGKSFD